MRGMALLGYYRAGNYYLPPAESDDVSDDDSPLFLFFFLFFASFLTFLLTYSSHYSYFTYSLYSSLYISTISFSLYLLAIFSFTLSLSNYFYSRFLSFDYSCIEISTPVISTPMELNFRLF